MSGGSRRSSSAPWTTGLSVADKRTYVVRWSDEDAEYVATCPDFPSLSWLAPTRAEALKGIEDMVMDVAADAVG